MTFPILDNFIQLKYTLCLAGVGWRAGEKMQTTVIEQQ